MQASQRAAHSARSLTLLPALCRRSPDATLNMFRCDRSSLTIVGCLLDGIETALALLNVLVRIRNVGEGAPTKTLFALSRLGTRRLTPGDRSAITSIGPHEGFRQVMRLYRCRHLAAAWTRAVPLSPSALRNPDSRRQIAIHCLRLLEAQRADSKNTTRRTLIVKTKESCIERLWYESASRRQSCYPVIVSGIGNHPSEILTVPSK
jgi:hypothetical protein